HPSSWRGRCISPAIPRGHGPRPFPSSDVAASNPVSRSKKITLLVETNRRVVLAHLLGHVAGQGLLDDPVDARASREIEEGPAEAVHVESRFAMAARTPAPFRSFPRRRLHDLLSLSRLNHIAHQRAVYDATYVQKGFTIDVSLPPSDVAP